MRDIIDGLVFTLLLLVIAAWTLRWPLVIVALVWMILRVNE